MSHTIILLERAINEANDALKYYEEQQIGLSKKFEANLYKALFYIQTNPLHFRIEKKKFRQLLIPRFPYVIIYRVVRNKIYIQSIFHTSRNPVRKYKK